MKFSFNKIRAAISNTSNTEDTLDASQIENIISSVDGDPFAISEQNVLFAKTSELGGYFYVIALIIGSFKIKTNKGAKLEIKGNDFDLKLNSDTDEFESDHSNIPNRFITRIDFQIEEDDVSKFDQKAITSLKLSAKKKEIVFNTL